MNQSEFDLYSRSYHELLADPLRDHFAASGPDFFHIRKRDLIRSYFRKRGIDTRKLSYLDVGCGFGRLLSLLRDDFGRVAGCDVSQGMIDQASGLEVRLQEHPCKMPFNAGEFDVVSAACVYHHVLGPDRIALTKDIVRVMTPGATLAIIEHNPWNPVTRLIVSRSPIDREAQLLTSSESKAVLSEAGLVPEASFYFLFFPERLYTHGGARIEGCLSRLPLGGQYAIFGQKCQR